MRSAKCGDAWRDRHSNGGKHRDNDAVVI